MSQDDVGFCQSVFTPLEKKLLDLKNAKQK